MLEVLEFSAMTRPELSENGSGQARETRLGRVDSQRPGAQDSVVRTPTYRLLNNPSVNLIDCRLICIGRNGVVDEMGLNQVANFRR